MYDQAMHNFVLQLRKIDRNFKKTLVILEKLYYNMNHIKQGF